MRARAARLLCAWGLVAAAGSPALAVPHQRANLHARTTVGASSPCTAKTAGGLTPVEDCAIVAGDGRLHIRRAALSRAAFDRNGLGEIRIGPQYYFLTRSGRSAPAFAFDNGADYFVAGLARTVRNGKIGFVNTRLVEVVPARWDFAFPFDHGFARVCEGCTAARTDAEHSTVTGGRWGYIDRTGTIVVPVEYAERDLPKPRSER
jgi:hypothetical protein